MAPSALRAPISPITPRALSDDEVEQTIEDFVRCARLAQDAGYDGVEVMGSEGYLINEFVAPCTNRRTIAGAARSSTGSGSRSRSSGGPRAAVGRASS